MAELALRESWRGRVWRVVGGRELRIPGEEPWTLDDRPVCAVPQLPEGRHAVA